MFCVAPSTLSWLLTAAPHAWCSVKGNDAANSASMIFADGGTAHINLMRPRPQANASDGLSVCLVLNCFTPIASLLLIGGHVCVGMLSDAHTDSSRIPLYSGSSGCRSRCACGC